MHVDVSVFRAQQRVEDKVLQGLQYAFDEGSLHRIEGGLVVEQAVEGFSQAHCHIHLGGLRGAGLPLFEIQAREQIDQNVGDIFEVQPVVGLVLEVAEVHAGHCRQHLQDAHPQLILILFLFPPALHHLAS